MACLCENMLEVLRPMALIELLGRIPSTASGGAAPMTSGMPSRTRSILFAGPGRLYKLRLSYVLLALRERSLYRGDDDWFFASAATGGRSPLWMDPVLNLYVRPAAREGPGRQGS